MRILGCKSTHKKRNHQKFYYLLASSRPPPCSPPCLAAVPRASPRGPAPPPAPPLVRRASPLSPPLVRRAAARAAASSACSLCSGGAAAKAAKAAKAAALRLPLRHPSSSSASFRRFSSSNSWKSFFCRTKFEPRYFSFTMGFSANSSGLPLNRIRPSKSR